MEPWQGCLSLGTPFKHLSERATIELDLVRLNLEYANIFELQSRSFSCGFCMLPTSGRCIVNCEHRSRAVMVAEVQLPHPSHFMTLPDRVRIAIPSSMEAAARWRSLMMTFRLACQAVHQMLSFLETVLDQRGITGTHDTCSLSLSIQRYFTRYCVRRTAEQRKDLCRWHDCSKSAAAKQDS